MTTGDLDLDFEGGLASCSKVVLVLLLLLLSLFSLCPPRSSWDKRLPPLASPSNLSCKLDLCPSLLSVEEDLPEVGEALGSPCEGAQLLTDDGLVEALALLALGFCCSSSSESCREVSCQHKEAG